MLLELSKNYRQAMAQVEIADESLSLGPCNNNGKSEDWCDLDQCYLLGVILGYVTYRQLNHKPPL